jgi:hypothetical protein
LAIGGRALAGRAKKDGRRYEELIGVNDQQSWWDICVTKAEFFESD